jgi:hypothetical protein
MGSWRHGSRPRAPGYGIIAKWSWLHALSKFSSSLLFGCSAFHASSYYFLSLAFSGSTSCTRSHPHAFLVLVWSSASSFRVALVMSSLAALGSNKTSMLSAPCSWLRALGSVLSALCSWLRALGSVLLAPCSWLRALGSVLSALCSFWQLPLQRLALCPFFFLFFFFSFFFFFFNSSSHTTMQAQCVETLFLVTSYGC